MKKAGLKTFICSFVFSLFTILVVSSLFMRPRPLSSDLKIPQKNITLFLKQEAKFAGKAETIPVKKIALRLPEKPQEPVSDTVRTEIPLSFGTADEPTEPQLPLQADAGSSIPLEFSGGAVPVSRARPIYNGEEGQVSEDKIIKDYDIFIRKKPVIDKKDILLARKDRLPPKNNKDSTPSEKAVLPQKEKLKFAQAAVKSEPKEKSAAAQTSEPQLLIPLEYTGSYEKQPERKIEIAQSGENIRQIALADGRIPISSMNAPADATKSEVSPATAPQWETMAEKSRSSDDAWLVAKGAKHPKNSMVLEQEYSKPQNNEAVLQSDALKNEKDNNGEIQVAEISKNLLIPIPEEIMKEKNLTPRLGSSQHNREIEERLLEKERQERGFAEDFASEEDNKNETNDSQKAGSKSGGILSGITSLFKSSPKPENKNVTVIENPGENYEDNSQDIDKLPDSGDNILEKIRTGFKKKFYRGKILPTEIRLAFQPNRAEISGQTLNWLEAFANKTQEDATTALEIRIDGTSSRALQQKRLNLLYNILASKGVEYDKIKIVFTSREPNSFVIRTIKVRNDLDGGGINNTTAMQNGYYMRW